MKIYFLKKLGSVFYNFLIQSLLRPQIVIRRRAIISRVISSLFWPLKIQISQKKLFGHNPLGMLNHIGFQNFKKVEFWLKNRHFKNGQRYSLCKSHFPVSLFFFHNFCVKQFFFLLMNLRYSQVVINCNLWRKLVKYHKLFFTCKTY